MTKHTFAVNLLLLTSVAFFTACSTKTPKPELKKEKVTVFDIMGVNVSKSNTLHVNKPNLVKVEAPLPLAKTYPMEEILELPIAACESYEPLYTPYTQLGASQVLYEEEYDPSLQVHTSSTFSEVYQPDMTQGEVVPTLKKPPARAGCKPYKSRYSHIKAVESNAKRLLGIKYVWGATGPYKYDCSGFTQKIYRDAGINIPRVSRDQAKVGEYISYNNLQKGDMVFFDTHKKKTGKVTHVGIYLGQGNFIHASSAAKKIVIFNFNKKKFYKNRFLWGRRVIQDRGHLASL
jgi:hypothetical protein